MSLMCHPQTSVKHLAATANYFVCKRLVVCFKGSKLRLNRVYCVFYFIYFSHLGQDYFAVCYLDGIVLLMSLFNCVKQTKSKKVLLPASDILVAVWLNCYVL